MGRVANKVAFVTGAARGLGRSHAVRLAQEGADIIAVDIAKPLATAVHSGATPEDLAETVRQVEALDRRIVAAEADVRDYSALQAAVDDGVAQLGRLDIVVANAGMLGYGSAEEMPEEVWRECVEVNLTGAWLTVKAAIPHLKAGGRGGSIVITGSTSGLRGVEKVAPYVAAKHGVVGLMRSLALELAPDWIRVNVVHPTTVDTKIIQNETVYGLYTGSSSASREEFDEAAGDFLALPVPWVDPIDISNAVLWLASDEARYVTGVGLPVDAGEMLK